MRARRAKWSVVVGAALGTLVVVGVPLGCTSAGPREKRRRTPPVAPKATNKVTTKATTKPPVTADREESRAPRVADAPAAAPVATAPRVAPCAHPARLKLGIAEWHKRYDALDKRTYDGMGYVNKGGAYSMWMGWNENRILSSYLVMYDVTRETRYLDKVVRHVDVLLRRVQDANGDGLSLWLEKEGQEARCDYETSQIGAPIARFARVVHETPGLHAAYLAKAKEYARFVDENVVASFETFYGQKWGEFTDGRGILYSEHTDKKTGERVKMSRHNNQFASKAEIYLDLGVMLDNETYRDRATKMAKFLKGGMQLVDAGEGREAYHWHYHTKGGEWDTWAPNKWCHEGPEDIGHANTEIGFMVQAHKELGVFDETDIRRFVGTALFLQWNGDEDEPLLHQYMERGKTYNSTGLLWDYVALAQFDGRLLRIFETIVDRVYQKPDHYLHLGLRGDAHKAEPAGIMLAVARLIEAGTVNEKALAER